MESLMRGSRRNTILFVSRILLLLQFCLVTRNITQNSSCNARAESPVGSVPQQDDRRAHGKYFGVKHKAALQNERAKRIANRSLGSHHCVFLRREVHGLDALQEHGLLGGEDEGGELHVDVEIALRGRDGVRLRQQHAEVSAGGGGQRLLAPVAVEESSASCRHRQDVWSVGEVPAFEGDGALVAAAH